MNGIEYNVITGIITEVELDIQLPNPRIFEIQNRMSEIKTELNSYDYKTHKYIDGSLSDKEFESVKEIRKKLREEYNTIEEELSVISI